MPTYRYKAVAPGGTLEEGQMDGADETFVIHALQAAGYLPIRAGRAAQAWRRPLELLSVWRDAFKPQQLVTFTHDLALLLRAGLPLDHALHLIGELTGDPTERRVIDGLEAALRNGNALSAALAASIEAGFPPFYIALVRAGEAGGTLEPTLMRLHEYLERGQALRRAVRTALIYPALLLSVSVLSVLILLVFVVPQFGQLLADSGQPVPTSTQLVLSASESLRNHGWLVLGFMVAAAALLRRYLTREQNRARIDRALLRLPLLGDLIRRLDVARFTRALGTLLQNGVPLLAGVDIAGAALSNRTLCATLPTVIDSLKQGRGMAMPLLATGQFPRLAVQLIRIGEESGQLDSMLLRSADILDTEIKQRIQSLISILEPALIVVLGIVIAGILMSILTAILGMNDIAI